MNLLSNYLSSDQSDLDLDSNNINNMLTNENKLMNIFCENWKNFKTAVNEQLANTNKPANELVIDGSSYAQHVKARVNFANLMNVNRLWKDDQLDMLNYLYLMLIEDGSAECESMEFFLWLKKRIKSSSYSDLCKIYEIFESKLCADSKNIQKLTLIAFESYLSIFVVINCSKGLIDKQYSAEVHYYNFIIRNKQN